jgi:predicted nuclease of predicted toxin-antitoxin system
MPLQFLADEDFRRRIVRGLSRRVSGLDLLRVQDVGLAGAADPIILEWAAQEGRAADLRCQHDA